ncbi:MAG TPA: transketolase, partial [Lacipirellulaceae bacterium]|nr:transketolase [Lacipirellulaceae bacterium]
MATTSKNIADLAINTIRTLAMDGVQAANSGHPGTPMALAPVSYELWTSVLRYDPTAPQWPNRDRYVLSCGHASMLIYSLLHLAQVRKTGEDGQPTEELAVSLDDLKNFRQWGSMTPGHPEYGYTTGVETTTGPLGQGCGNSVGMAIASQWMAARYNRPGFKLFDYNVYVQCSDGDLMEGVSCEAASLAGHLKLPNLCWIYDDNKITIEGRTELAFSEDVPARFRSLGWKIVEVDDANDLQAIAAAFEAFQVQGGPMLIVLRSVIGYGAPKKAGTASAHGEPLGADEIRGAKGAYGWPQDESFRVPAETLEHFAATLGQRGRDGREAWDELFAAYRAKHPELAAEIDMIQRREFPQNWDATLLEFPPDAKGAATRISGGQALNAFAAKIPWLLGGSADLAPSTKTLLTFDKVGDFSADNFAGRNFHFGVREHAMASAVNGMALCGLRAYGATFFVFSDYLRPAMRLAALMSAPSIFVFTHDSIGVGEDGPTHQPVEQLAAARAIPELIVLRPGDANEAVHAWRAALAEKKRPSALVLTRQNMPTLDRARYASAAGVARGAYILADAPGGKPQVILIGSGSELSLAVAAYEELAQAGVPARVVSMPSFELFEKQDAAYRDEVLPPAVTARVAVEAGIRQGWDAYIGSGGAFVGMSHFGASAPEKVIYEKMGITSARIVA